MALSIIQSLLVPKLLGYSQYGFWQLFLFYTSYVGFFHFGLADGIYLINGGKARDVIDKKSINSQFFFGLAFQILFALVIVTLSLSGAFGRERDFVIFWTGVYLVIQNAATYLGYVFQAMNETKLFSYSCILERFMFLVPLVALLVSGNVSFEPYVYAYCFSSCCQVAYCLYYARDFLSSGLERPGVAIREGLRSIRIGSKLMVANIASQLILGFARFTIDAVWGIETFGKLSLALSLVNFFLAIIGQASMVLFPALRQSEESQIVLFYRTARDMMTLFLPIIYVLFFPLVWILGLWLPAYADSFRYFALLVPICVFESKMAISCTTLFKVRREETILLKINIITTLASALGTAVSAYAIDSAYAVLGVVVACIVGRSFWSEWHFNREFCLTAHAASCAEILLTVLFSALTLAFSYQVAFILFTCAYALFLFLFRNRASELLRGIIRLRKR